MVEQILREDRKFEDLELRFLNIEDIWTYVYNENIRQVRKWGIQKHTLTTWHTIAAEEFGEFGKALLEYTFGDEDARLKMHDEGIQTITLLLKIMETVLHSNEVDE
ncbi:MAG: hypothetical protein ACFFF4_09935 [Candidatus Thorarchaeota archaeon]